MSTYQVRSLEEADQIIREHERKTKTTYALLRSTKNFGCVDVPGEDLQDTDEAGAGAAGGTDHQGWKVVMGQDMTGHQGYNSPRRTGPQRWKVAVGGTR